MSWLVLEGPNEKMGVLSFEQETCPKTGLRRSNQVSPSTTPSLLCNFCKFVLARHDDVITLFTDGPLLCPLISLVP